MDNGNAPDTAVSYDEDYFERGLVLGISGYVNYSWMPELTLRMAHHMVMNLPIGKGETVLDYGCAKGFLVRALRTLDVDAFGADISSYAIDNVDGAVRKHCAIVSGVDDPALFERKFDWLISKDVLEHLTEDDVRVFLRRGFENTRKLFIVVPLAAGDADGTYIIPEYDRDVTHIVRKSMAWWKAEVEAAGWTIDRADYTFPGCKENWTSKWPEGNAFIVGRHA